MIDESMAEKALDYLASTDASCAMAKGVVKGLEYRLKVARAVEFLTATGTMAEKEATALASTSYVDLVYKYEEAIIEFETIAAKRERAVLTVDVWRTESSNRRKG